MVFNGGGISYFHVMVGNGGLVGYIGEQALKFLIAKSFLSLRAKCHSFVPRSTRTLELQSLVGWLHLSVTPPQISVNKGIELDPLITYTGLVFLLS